MNLLRVHFRKIAPLAATLALTWFATSRHLSASDEGEWKISIDPDTVIREVELADLLGSNAGLWYHPQQIERVAKTHRDLVQSWGPGVIRIPGGSWSDEIYWNGAGVRDGKQFDQTKFKDGFWTVDYSDYKPGFRVVNGGGLSDFHGNIDVKSAHEFVRDIGAAALVTVNAGSGTPEMAAEWVKWAKKNGYPVRYWEVGNELEGQWEGRALSPGGRGDDRGDLRRALRGDRPGNQSGRSYGQGRWGRRRRTTASCLPTP